MTIDNIRWSIRILFARNFVAMTKKKSAIHLTGLKPTKLKYMLALLAQKQALTVFDEGMHQLIKDHKHQVKELEKKAEQAALQKRKERELPKKLPVIHRNI